MHTQEATVSPKGGVVVKPIYDTAHNYANGASIDTKQLALCSHGLTAIIRAIGDANRTCGCGDMHTHDAFFFALVYLLRYFVLSSI